MRRAARSALVAVGLIAAACGSDSDPEPAAAPAAETAAPDQALTGEALTEEAVTEEAVSDAAVPATYLVQPSVNQLHVLGAEPGQELELVLEGEAVSTGVVDEQGSLMWRDLAVGSYVVRTVGTDPVMASAPAAVFGPDDPPPFDPTVNELGEGYGYLLTRDGTSLSVNVVFPGGEPPYPTVVEYSGYSPSDPGDTTFAQLFTTLGYAYVGVNIRGTGCSGGSFQFFEPIQSLDGYDMIQAIAAQPWVLHNQVGMVGVSYPGISQLFVAQTQPPGLAAITPLSVLDDSYRSTLYPGGILNTGFAVDWSNDRFEEAKPSGQPWAAERIAEGDTACAANQALRLQNPDQLALIEANEFYDPAIGDEIAPVTFVDDITVPVFLAGAWQDEQTGGHFPAMLDRFTSSPLVSATMVNGSHTESLSLGIIGPYVDFLDLYVARRVPANRAGIVGPIVAGGITGVTGLAVPPDPRYAGLDYEAALAVYEADDPIRILFEQGAADDQPPGSPLPRFEARFDAWPVPGAEATPWYLSADGAMASAAPAASAEPLSYTADPDAVPATIYEGDSNAIWQAEVPYDWREPPAGTAASWVSEPLAADTVAIGSGSVDLWIRASAPDTDLEVTLSEVRADGTEVYVQSGWLRASHRALDQAASTETRPVHTHLAADAAPLPADEFVEVRVELFPFAHPFRAGSRLRLTVDAPGGARPLWAFAETIAGGETVEIAADADHPSRLVLAVVDGIAVPPGAPPCGSLRSQPCRSPAAG